MGLVSVYYQRFAYNTRESFVKSDDYVEIGIPISVCYQRFAYNAHVCCSRVRCCQYAENERYKGEKRDFQNKTERDISMQIS